MPCAGQLQTLLIVMDPVVHFCNTLKRVTPSQRIHILTHISKKQVSLARQIAYNVLINKDIALSEKDKKYFRRHLTSIKELASKKINLDRKRLILVKKHLLFKRLCIIILTYLK